MSAKSIFGTARNVSILIRDLEAAGMRVEVGDDFALYRNYRNACAGRGGISPIFDAASSFIDETNGFWICGFNGSDEVIHTQAVRLLDLSGITLGKHLDMHRHKYIVPDTTPDPDLTFFQGPEALKTVSGSVGYCGDFWLTSLGLGGPRSQGATTLLSRLLFEILQQAFSPDFVFAFVPQQLAAKGAHLRYGYTHCEPGRWIGPDQQVTDEEYMIWMSAGDIKNVLARDVQSVRPAGQVAAIRTPLASIDSVR
ncbi:MAG: hypothetical protein NWQ23_15885 [Yoonia sp.]|uniref:hypothetical protein n=1 Tax=Yoonia sp. TaxID=2212373 RepID=UPI00273E9835|nr:hypothetical protein [Yoonia sp.]MDP5086899.1 hypothetical protein [Yoonia sp.]MDP5362725.1 hypothetical protein [Paracoccaceae bacterium]